MKWGLAQGGGICEQEKEEGWGGSVGQNVSHNYHEGVFLPASQEPAVFHKWWVLFQGVARDRKNGPDCPLFVDPVRQKPFLRCCFTVVVSVIERSQ